MKTTCAWALRHRWLWRVIAALAVAALALWLRLRAVERLPIDYDEDDYLRAGLQYAQAMQQHNWAEFTQLNYRPEHPPLAKIVFGAVLAHLPAPSEIPDRPPTAGPAGSLPQPYLREARTSAAVAGTLEVLFLALLNPLAGLLLAIHTFTIKYTSQVMLEALPALTSAVAVLAYDRSRRQWGGWIVLSAVAMGLTAASKYVYCIVAPAILLHWLWAARHDAGQVGSRWRRLWPMAAWIGLAVLLFFAADPYLWPAPLQRLRDSISYHAQYTQSTNVRRAGYPFWQPLTWIYRSVPWHPGVFWVAIDGLIALVALAGLTTLWQRNRLYALWLAVGLAFLLVWPTKWPQYILVLTVPLCLASAEGVRVLIWQPLVKGARRLRARLSAGPRPQLRLSWRQTRRACPWLAPGVVVLVLITYYPLLFQGGIAITDFSATSIKDGVQGGIWREVREGLTGQVQAAPSSAPSTSASASTKVHYAGFAALRQMFSGAAADLLVFEAVWTVLAVLLQAVLGVGAALLLHRQGVRFKGGWQTLFILPWAIPEFVGALIWMQIFDPKFGWFFLGAETFPRTPGYLVAQQLTFWQGNPNAALAVLLIAGTWVGFPLIMLAASAGLKMTPQEVYDAAAIDGAGRWQTFRSVTWPLLLPLLAPALILRGIAAFNAFYLFWVLNSPYPASTLSTVSYAIFRRGGYAAAATISVFTVVALVVLLLWFSRWSKAGEGVTYA